MRCELHLRKERIRKRYRLDLEFVVDGNDEGRFQGLMWNYELIEIQMRLVGRLERLWRNNRRWVCCSGSEVPCPFGGERGKSEVVAL